ncbi:hypothetical protein ACWDOP_33200 [Nocardia sp. NPDC003693]
MPPRPPMPARASVPARQSGLWFLALPVAALAAVLIIAFQGPDRITGKPIPADHLGFQPTSTTTMTEPAPKKREEAPQRFPALTPGWKTAFAVTRNALYDVPPDWASPGPGWVGGFEGKEYTLYMRGLATYGEGACGGYDTQASAGIAGSALSDPAAAAREAAPKWTKVALEESGMGGWSTPTTYTEEPITVQGRNGFHVTASIVNQGTIDCARPPAAVLHVVAIPDGNGQTILMIVFSDQNFAGAPTAEAMRQMYTSVRPAGLGRDECKKDFEVVGNWC